MNRYSRFPSLSILSVNFVRISFNSITSLFKVRFEILSFFFLPESSVLRFWVEEVLCLSFSSSSPLFVFLLREFRGILLAPVAVSDPEGFFLGFFLKLPALPWFVGLEGDFFAWNFGEAWRHQPYKLPLNSICLPINLLRSSYFSR